MPLKLIRRPRYARVLHKIIRDEVREEYNNMALDMIERLKSDIVEWEKKPKFTFTVQVGEKRWGIWIHVDRKSPIGKIYRWVDEGTGQAAGHGGKYPIVPVHADALAFGVPNQPKTEPSLVSLRLPAVVLSDYGKQTTIYKKKVMHPGIRPRFFTQSLRDEMKAPTRRGGFRMRTEAAIKRAKRKIGKQ